MDNDSPARTDEPLALQSNDLLGQLPTSAEDDAVVQARLSKTPAEAYERGHMDGHAKGVAAERERWRSALGACDAALGQCQPCQDPRCGAVQRDYIDTARDAARLLLRPNVVVTGCPAPQATPTTEAP